MRLFSTRLLPRTLFLSIVVSAFATPIIVRPRGNEGASHTGEASNSALVHSDHSFQSSYTQVGESSSEKLDKMKLVLIRERKSSLGGQYIFIDVGAPVQPDERWTLAFLPEVTRKTKHFGIRTIRQKQEDGHFKWVKDVTYTGRRDREGPGRLLLARIDPDREYEVLGEVLLSSTAKSFMTLRSNKVAPKINLFYLDTQVTTALEAKEFLELQYPERIDSPQRIVVLKDSKKWNTFSLPMLHARGSGAGFAITEKDHPEEWKLYVQAEKDLAEKEAEEKEQEEKKKAENEAQTGRVDGTLEAMDAALFG
ncbi:hypothetical protein F5878DRAFT_122863 [Lentinula raphanica]|uniref:Uncharacterized protein n=1 Tax=Lentinula raphanica TaxID=153919 RepID=A0AA38PAM0_9AGAR|nr:hypothetical protein F5878DRAFT_122863 [Lentinula raphanica]